MGVCLAAYRIERGPEAAAQTIEAITSVHRKLDVPATLFVVTRLFELAGDHLAELLGGPLFEVQSHTHYHCALVTEPEHPGLAPEDARQELRRSLGTLQRLFPGDLPGLLVPFAPTSGLAGQSDLLHIVHDAGIRYVRSAATSATAGAWELGEPYCYAADGFPDLLEIPRSAAPGERDVEAAEQRWRAAVESAASSSSSVEVPVTWESRTPPAEDLAGRLEAMLRYAQAAGLRIVACRDLYAEQAVEGSAAPQAAKLQPPPAAAPQRGESLLLDANHELRSALNPISGYAEMLAGELSGPLNVRQRRWVGEIQRAAQHTLSLLESVVDVTRLDAGQLALEIEVLPVQQLLRDALRQAKALAAPDQLAQQVEIAPDATAVWGDERWLGRALGCLLSNAVLFSPGDVRLELTARRRGQWVEISITDHGRGIPPEAHSRIFERRGQVPGPPGRRTPGVGLGLPLARGIVQLLGGTVVLDRSAPGDGSTFILRLPAAEPPPEAGR